MEDLQGRWLARTPFGPIELVVDKDGGFDLAGRTGLLEVAGTALRVAGTDLHLPGPQDGSWWIPLPDSGGVLRFNLQPADDLRTLQFGSGLSLDIPADWISGEAPGAMAVHPPMSARPGLPPSSFIEIYESLAPLDSAVLEAAMVSMLKDRTGSAVAQPPETIQVGGRNVHCFRSRATPPTGERVRVALWVMTSDDHILALAQAASVGDVSITDETIKSILESVDFPRWGRDDRLIGRWHRTNRRPSGPLTEVVERRLALDEDGSYLRTRNSLLEVPESSQPASQQPRESRERIGLWYARDDQLLLSAGLQGYRVQRFDLRGDALLLDDENWTRV